MSIESVVFRDVDGTIYPVRMLTEITTERLTFLIRRAAIGFQLVTNPPEHLTPEERDADLRLLDKQMLKLFCLIVPSLDKDRAAVIDLQHKLTFIEWWIRQQPAIQNWRSN